IGNTDWSMLASPPGATRCCHNTILISPDDGPYVPVPYDFDYSGIINTSYAVPSESTGLQSVRKRAYRGLCPLQGDLDSTLQKFRDNKDAIYALFNQQPGLSKGTLKKTTIYLDQFYKTINDPRRVKRNIIDRCR
ncbi:MAG: hypothetical protein KJO35_08670, partial [Gammaproteobacteria bacterium]|nr:hypothetical protein [Gammaproteobacteria bacterium]